MSNLTETDTGTPKRIVVLGSGYAGVHAIRQLIKASQPEDNIEIILLSNSDHLLYVTMIYEVAAGNLAPSSIRQSVRTMLPRDNAHFLQGKVTRVDFDNQTINYLPADARMEDSEVVGGLSLSYDYLISAIGSETKFYDTPGAEEYAHTLKTLADARQLKNTLINHFERASLVEDEGKQRELLSIVVVGGGPTGVTLAAKIADLLNDELAQAFPDLVALSQITILEGSNKVLGKVGSWFSQKAHAALEEKNCVRILTNHKVTEVRPDGVMSGDTFIRSQYVVWAAGVKAREFKIEAAKPVEIDSSSRRIHVTETLQIPSYKNVLVAGDQSWVERGQQGPYPMRAQFAVRQGKQAADNVLRDLRGDQPERFFWTDKGLVVSVGEGRTYAEVGGFKLSGPLATIAYKSIYLMSTVGIRAKLRALLEWGMNLFLPRDISEL